MRRQDTHFLCLPKLLDLNQDIFTDDGAVGFCHLFYDYFTALLDFTTIDLVLHTDTAWIMRRSYRYCVDFRDCCCCCCTDIDGFYHYRYCWISRLLDTFGFTVLISKYLELDFTSTDTYHTSIYIVDHTADYSSSTAQSAMDKTIIDNYRTNATAQTDVGSLFQERQLSNRQKKRRSGTRLHAAMPAAFDTAMSMVAQSLAVFLD